MHTRRLRDSWPLILALGATQIIGYGSIFYSFSLLMEPLQHGLGASKNVVVGAFSVALLVAGVCAYFVGSTIDRIGGRRVMTFGSLAAALLLAALSQVQSVAGLYVLYAALGVTMAAVLYEPAFAVLTQAFGTQFRRAITMLTLMGGFASTVFWPLTQQLIAHLGWRNAVLVLAAANALICVPLHFLLLPARQRARADAAEPGAAADSHSLREAISTPSFWWLCGVFIANGLIFSAMSVHMIPVLQSRGLSAAAAAAIGAIVGPMQVAGRLLELTMARRYSIVHVGLLAITLLPVSLLVLYSAQADYPRLALFAAIYGLSNGVITIVRGALPAELFGRDHYGAVSGALAMPAMLALATGPFLASLLWSAMGGHYDGALAGLCLIGVLATLFFRAATRRHRARAH